MGSAQPIQEWNRWGVAVKDDGAGSSIVLSDDDEGLIVEPHAAVLMKNL